MGKTATEAATLTKQLYHQVVAQQSAAPQVNLNQPPAFVPQTNIYGQPVSTDPYQQQQQDPLAATRNMIAPEFQSRDNMLGAQARAIAEMQYKDDFKRWGPEIDMALNVIPPAQRTPQVVDWIVRGVRGSHINELINETAEARLKSLVESGQLRPQGADGAGGSASNRVDFDRLPPRYRSVLDNLGVTPSTVDEMLRTCYPGMPLDKAREKWMKQAEKGDVITDGAGKFHYEGDNNG